MLRRPPVQSVDERSVRSALPGDRGAVDRFLTDLEREVGDRVVLAWLDADTSSSGAIIAVWGLIPFNPSALAIRVEIDEEFARIVADHNGGVWELHDDIFTTELIVATTQAVVEGRAQEVFGPGRSTVASGWLVEAFQLCHEQRRLNRQNRS